ncbi:nucleotidyltransferase domain-containing protein [Candidatus Woesearchaeota archaeon]|nr:nucleotidyltransferase domain-containing protein [Candidatus Woesearchaeota archaeon]
MDNKLKIINYLGKNIGKDFTMHNLSSLTKIPYATFHREIKRMEKLLSIKEVGKAKTISLSLSNQDIKAYLAVASSQEREEYLKSNPIIRKISSELSTDDSVILFGSYANSKHTEKSDIDLMIINNDGKKTLSFSKYELLFKKKINPIFITRKEFVLMLKDKEENVGKQALKNHIILNNAEEFWKGVLSGFQQG